MTPAIEKQIYTPEEYFELELASETRSEYRNGEIIPMTGGTPNHNEIAINLASLLKVALRGQSYRIFATDQRLWIPTVNLHTYPDVMVVEKPMQLQAGRKDTVINPCFIAEVLSKSTRNYDRSEKFVSYRTIETLREYLLIDQYNFHVEHYIKTSDRQWLFSEYNDPALSLSCDVFQCQIKICDLYENIDFV